MAGVDTVSNALALTGGADAESDTAFRTRFGTYLASLARATDVAIGAAISGIQQGLSYAIVENVDQTGAVQMGHFVVTVDDGSGNPPAALLSTVQQAVDAVRPVGSSFAVQGPVVTLANVSMTLSTASGASHSAAVAAVATAVEAYIASLASSSVTNVSAVLLNGALTDVSPGVFGAVRSGSVAVA